MFVMNNWTSVSWFYFVNHINISSDVNIKENSLFEKEDFWLILNFDVTRKRDRNGQNSKNIRKFELPFHSVINLRI